MTFQEILPYLKNGKKVRRESHKSPNYYIIWAANSFIDRYENLFEITMQDLEATDWELYKEPEPEPEKTLGQIVYEIGKKCNVWNSPDNWDYFLEKFATEIEDEVLRRHYASLPKPEGKTAGQVFWELYWEQTYTTQHDLNKYKILHDADKQLLETKAARFLAAYQLTPSKHRAEVNLLTRLHEADSEIYFIIEELVQYLIDCKTDKYEADKDSKPLNMRKGMFSGEKGTGFNALNALKYIDRYYGIGFEKSRNPKDLIKAIHYLIFELKNYELNYGNQNN
jgi:hypothetical protein